MNGSEEYGQQRYFPAFMDSSGKRIAVIGGGKVAERRIRTLARYCFSIEVYSPEITEGIRQIVNDGRATYYEAVYKPAEIEGADAVLACTDDEKVNREICRDCRRLKKPHNNCSSSDDSSFWFPAVALNDELSVGIVGDGTDHGNVKRAAAHIRKIVEEKDY